MNKLMHVHSFAGVPLRQWINERTSMLHRHGGPAVEFSNGDKSWCLQGLTFFQSRAEFAIRRHSIEGDLVNEDGMTWTANGHPIQLQRSSSLKVLEDFPGYGTESA